MALAEAGVSAPLAGQDVEGAAQGARAFHRDGHVRTCVSFKTFDECPNVRMSECPNVQMSECPNVRMPKCPNVASGEDFDCIKVLMTQQRHVKEFSLDLE